MNNLLKNSYPAGLTGNIEINQYNITKWQELCNKIYQLINLGNSYYDSFNNVTQDLDDTEKKDFRHWLKFYQENTHMKYKFAQTFESFPMSNGNIIPGQMYQGSKPDLSKEELVKKKINSIISRLQSAERIATHPDIRETLSKSLQIPLSKWLEELHAIKRHIQTAKISNAKTIDDLIVKHAYKIHSDGYPLASNYFKKIAQAIEPIQPGPSVGPLPGLPIPTDPNAATLPSSEIANESVDQQDLSPLDKLIKNLNFSDENDVNDIMGPEGDYDDPLAEIVVTAQEAIAPPSQQPPQKAKETALTGKQPPPQESVVSPGGGMQFADTVLHKKTDDLIEAALGQVTVKDIIYRLESLVNLFRTREIPRQLAIVDLMMDHLNLSSFFPTLAEASSKTLESNQYALTRIEEILSKLKGSIKNPKEQEIDLLGENKPNVDQIPDNIDLKQINESLKADQLEQEQMKEQRRQERTQLSKEKQDLASPPQSELEVSEDELAQPAQVVTQPTVQTQPPKQPAAR